MKYNLVTFKKLRVTDGSFRYDIVYEKGIEVPSKILLDPMMGAYYYLKGTKEESFELLKEEMINSVKSELKKKNYNKLNLSRLTRNLKTSSLTRTSRNLRL